jgi:tetratricopeptide (TPR) repeat protein
VEIPKTIGPFELRRAIGHGTYGHVFEAFDPEREIRAAVKLYGDAPKGEAAFTRLRRDAQAAGALGHPNIATVIAVGEYEGVPWVATELVDGVSLYQVMNSRTFWPIERVLDVWRQLCEGLAHAHREGLLHLDLKPSDIRVAADGDVKVVDFGAWHVRSLERRRSAPAGESLHYRPPEVLAGDRPDKRADIFAVGAIIYELIMRRKAFPGDSTADVIRSLTKCEPDLATLPSSPFSPGFEKALAASLERLPASRPPSFEDVHADLVELVRDTAPRLRVPTEASEPTPEREGFLLELTRARAEDRLEDAMNVCRKLLALDPDDIAARRAMSDVEGVILSREADELVGEALTLAADGDIAKATRLAEKLERLAPWSPRYLELQVYLDEEGARREADELVAAAEEHQAAGRDEEARAAMQKALDRLPGHAAASRYLREEDDVEDPGPDIPDLDFTSTSGPLTPSDALRAATADPTRIPAILEQADPPDDEADPVGGEAHDETPPDAMEADDSGAEVLEALQPVDALLASVLPEEPPLESFEDAAPPEIPMPDIESFPVSVVPDTPEARAEALTADALQHFTCNDHPRALEAVGQALELDPANPRARDLERILRVLG